MLGDPRAILDVVMKKKIPTPPKIQNPAINPISSLFTYRAAGALTISIMIPKSTRILTHSDSSLYPIIFEKELYLT
jgi:hypothetical protein